MSQGVGPALDFCVRHPDRVSYLIVLGGYVRGMRRRDADSAAQAALLPELIRLGWGGSNQAFRSVFTTTFVPEATSEQMRWFNELTVHTASADNAVRLETSFHGQDFTDLAQRSRHHLGDARNERPSGAVQRGPAARIADPGSAVRAARQRQPHPARG
jgi:hypothetical protein